MEVRKPRKDYNRSDFPEMDSVEHVDFLEYIETFNPPGMNYDRALGEYGSDLEGPIDIKDIVVRVLGEGRYSRADTEVVDHDFIGERDELYRRAIDEMNTRDNKFEVAKILLEEAQYRNEIDVK